MLLIETTNQHTSDKIFHLYFLYCKTGMLYTPHVLVHVGNHKPNFDVYIEF